MKEKMRMDIESDDDEIERLLDKYDPDYLEKMENKNLGFFMENFLVAHAICPVCQKKKVYANIFIRMFRLSTWYALIINII